jgi:hypothetical protein
MISSEKTAFLMGSSLISPGRLLVVSIIFRKIAMKNYDGKQKLTGW